MKRELPSTISRGGGRDALDRLLPRIQDELRRLAMRRLRREPTRGQERFEACKYL